MSKFEDAVNILSQIESILLDDKKYGTSDFAESLYYVYNKLGDAYRRLNETRKSFQYYQQAIELAEDSHVS